MSKPVLITLIAIFSFLWACLIYLGWAWIFALFTGAWPGIVWPAVLGLAAFFALTNSVIFFGSGRR